VITIGIDPHSRTHSAAALDDHGRILAEFTVGSNARELDRLTRWITGMGPERVVAIEGARGFGQALSRRLLVAGETVVDVAPALTVGERRAARRPGKDDRGDAVAVGRIALREQSLPRVSTLHPDTRSRSWLNPVEVCFSILTRQAIAPSHLHQRQVPSWRDPSIHRRVGPLPCLVVDRGLRMKAATTRGHQ
jgi:transposase